MMNKLYVALDISLHSSLLYIIQKIKNSRFESDIVKIMLTNEMTILNAPMGTKKQNKKK